MEKMGDSREDNILVGRRFCIFKVVGFLYIPSLNI